MKNVNKDYKKSWLEKKQRSKPARNHPWISNKAPSEEMKQVQEMNRKSFIP